MKWDSIKSFFKSSETIFWARLNSLVGLATTALTFVDPALVQPLLTPQNFALYILLNGVATEYLRRRRAADLGKTAEAEYPHENV